MAVYDVTTTKINTELNNKIKPQTKRNDNKEFVKNNK